MRVSTCGDGFWAGKADRRICSDVCFGMGGQALRLRAGGFVRPSGICLQASSMYLCSTRFKPLQGGDCNSLFIMVAQQISVDAMNGVDWTFRDRYS